MRPQWTEGGNDTPTSERASKAAARGSLDDLMSIVLGECGEESDTPVEEEEREEVEERMRAARKRHPRDVPEDLQAFVDCFKKPGSDKVPKPIQRLVEWFLENEDKMWICRSPDNHLELTYDRPSLIRYFATRLRVEVEQARKTVQNFERCLNSVKPKLIVLESTHGKEIKRIGFASPELIFGTQRSVYSKKVERQLNRRAAKRGKRGTSGGAEARVLDDGDYEPPVRDATTPPNMVALAAMAVVTPPPLRVQPVVAVKLEFE